MAALQVLSASVSFDVSFDGHLSGDKPLSGRVLVYLTTADHPTSSPIDACSDNQVRPISPFWQFLVDCTVLIYISHTFQDTSQVFGIDATNLRPDETASIAGGILGCN